MMADWKSPVVFSVRMIPLKEILFVFFKRKFNFKISKFFLIRKIHLTGTDVSQIF